MVMAIPYFGGCQCGRVRYEVRSAPIMVYVCHCQDCQCQSSSAFGMSMSVPREAVVLLQGEPKQWSRPAASGREVVCFFCGDCGVRLFHQPSRNPAITNIKPGTLDDTNWLRPVANVWTKRSQPWVICDDALLTIEGQPTAAELALMQERFELKYNGR
jgi:hypothetical protein